MRIAQISPLWERVPPFRYGGIELIVQLLTDELVRRSHEVTLFTSGDSITKANLCSVHNDTTCIPGICGSFFSRKRASASN